MSLAIAWAAAHPGITCSIIGARNTDQLKASLAAVDITLSPEQRDKISALSRTPPVATDRLVDQRSIILFLRGFAEERYAPGELIVRQGDKADR